MTTRRVVEIPLPPPNSDERELQFDVRRLENGDTVEVFLESERSWLRGTFHISNEGAVFIEVPQAAFLLEDALDMGLKRILH